MTLATYRAPRALALTSRQRQISALGSRSTTRPRFCSACQRGGRGGAWHGQEVGPRQQEKSRLPCRTSPDTAHSASQVTAPAPGG